MYEMFQSIALEFVMKLVPGKYIFTKHIGHFIHGLFCCFLSQIFIKLSWNILFRNPPCKSSNLNKSYLLLNTVKEKIIFK